MFIYCYYFHMIPISVIIKNQKSDEFLEKSCKYIIYNDEKKFLTPQIIKLHEIFIKLI